MSGQMPFEVGFRASNQVGPRLPDRTFFEVGFVDTKQPGTPIHTIDPACSMSNTISEPQVLAVYDLLVKNQEQRDVLAPKMKDLLEKEQRLLDQQKSTCHDEPLAAWLVDFAGVSRPLFAELLSNEFGNPNVLRLAECVTKAETQRQVENHTLKFLLEYRMRIYIRTMKPFGARSESGIAFLASVDEHNRDTEAAFVVKMAATPGTLWNEMLHEYFVGVHLNTLRDRVPNFAYMLGKFACSRPYMTSDGTQAIHWCHVSDMHRTPPTTFVLYEKILPSRSYLEWLLEETPSVDEVRCSLMQLGQALLLAQHEYEFMHMDLHPGNVLMRKLRTPTAVRLGSQWIQTRWIPTIIDYGEARIRVGSEVFERVTWLHNVYTGEFDEFADMYKFLGWVFHVLIKQQPINLRMANLLFDTLRFAWGSTVSSFDDGRRRSVAERGVAFTAPPSTVSLPGFLVHLAQMRPSKACQLSSPTMDRIPCSSSLCPSFGDLRERLLSEPVCNLQQVLLRHALLENASVCPELDALLRAARDQLFRQSAQFDRLLAAVTRAKRRGQRKLTDVATFTDAVMRFVDALDVYCLLQFQFESVLRLLQQKNEDDQRIQRVISQEERTALANVVRTQKAKIQAAYQTVLMLATSWRQRRDTSTRTNKLLLQNFLNVSDKLQDWFYDSFLPLANLPPLNTEGGCPEFVSRR